MERKSIERLAEVDIDRVHMLGALDLWMRLRYSSLNRRLKIITQSVIILEISQWIPVESEVESSGSNY